MAKTRMPMTTDNLAYIGRGTRAYGLRPVIGRARGYWEFEWIFSGRARPNPASSNITTEAPYLCVSHPDSPHGWTDDAANVSEVAVLHFHRVPGELVALVKPAESRIQPLSESEHRQVSARLNEIWEMHRAGDGRLALKLMQILAEVTLLIMDRSTAPAMRLHKGDRVARALHWFEENIGENPSAEQVAEAVGVSLAHLRRLFAEAGQGSPRQEMARLRMQAAQRCLRAGWKLERIARYLGFSEASVLSRAFSGVCGESPRQWLVRNPG